MGEDGVITAIRQSLIDQGVPGAATADIEIRRGSVVVTVTGDPDSISAINDALNNNNLTITINGQTYLASIYTGSSAGSSSDDDLSGGALAGIVIGVLAGVILVLLVIVLVVRHYQNERGSYEVDEAAHADTIVTDIDNYVPTLSDAMWDHEKPVVLLEMHQINARTGTSV